MGAVKERSEDLSKGSVGKLLLRLSIPTVLAQIINMLYNLVDRIYIGHIGGGEGSLALTGLGVCFPIIMIVSAFASFAASGGASRVSIFLGRKDKEGAERIVGNAFTLTLIISAVLTVVLLVFGRDLLMAFGASGNTIEYASSYLRIYGIGTLFVEITLGMNGFITSQGKTKISMISVSIGALLNIALDPIFIFALDMGVRGAALATIISQFVSSVFVLWFLTSKHSIVRLRAKNMIPSFKVIGPFVVLGFASFVMQSSESVIFVCYNSSLLKYGGDIAVGAMTIMTSIMQFISMPTQGFGQGAQPIIGYNYGEGNKERVKRAFFLLLVIDLSFTLVFFVLAEAFPSFFVSLFTDDSSLIEFTSKALRVYLGSIGLFGIQMACQMTFTSIGYAKSAIMVAVMRKFILIIPLIYLLPAVLPIDSVMAVYMSEPLSDLISVLFCSVLFFFQFRKALREMDRAKTQSTAAE